VPVTVDYKYQQAIDTKEKQMPHPIPAPDLIPFKKGDRVQNLDSGNFGTVYQDQTDPLLVHLVWDAEPNVVVCHKADSVRVAPWHEVNAVKTVKIDPVHLRNFREAGLLDPEKLPKEPKFRAGDRVKFKYNRNCGTVAEVSKLGVLVKWDKDTAEPLWEREDELVTLYAPRDTDPVNPNQDAIDAIEALRVPLKREIEALQAKLGNLTTAKKLLERG
jgi:hypothetical protein